MKRIAVFGVDKEHKLFDTCFIDHRLMFYVNPGRDYDAERYIRSRYYDIRRELESQGIELVYGPYLRYNIGDKIAGYMTGIPYAAVSNETILSIFPEELGKKIHEACLIKVSQDGNYEIYSFLDDEDYLKYRDVHRPRTLFSRSGDRFGGSSKNPFLDDRIPIGSLYEKKEKKERSLARRLYGRKYLEDEELLRLNDTCYALRPEDEMSVPVPDDCMASERYCNPEMEEMMEAALLDMDNEAIIRQMQRQLFLLRQRGFTQQMLMSLLAPRIHPSPMTITKDYRIILDDYIDTEIKLPAKYKAYYFLFLRHPEGINYSCMVDYEEELFHIYRMISLRKDTDKIRQSVHDIVDYESNEKNVCASYIKKAFISKLDESIASLYFIKGEQGESKKIELDQALVKWERKL